MQPSITPGQDGYLSPLQQTQWDNPWASMASQDALTAKNQIEQSNQTIGNLNQQEQSMDAPYPTFPNAAGAGSQSAYAKPSTPQAPQTSDSLRGANPWSLVGEASVR